MKRRVGLLGGTFNPIHNGHIELGLQIKEAFNLELIRYILSAKPPHKDNSLVTNTKIRWNMLECALEDISELIPCDVEIKRDDFSYTIDTLKKLTDMYPDEEHYFIIGSDGFLNIETWKDYLTLLKMIPFIVVLRQEQHRIEIINVLDKLSIKYYKGDLKDIKQEKSREMVFFYSYKSVTLRTSSTMIRNMIENKQDINSFVNPKIVEIIKGKMLYGSK